MTDVLVEPDFAVPDLAAAIEGWRVWHVVLDGGRYSLASVVKCTVWPAGCAVGAECLRSPLVRLWRHGPRHHAPQPDCGCGIYAAGLDELDYYLRVTPRLAGVGRVLGRVSLWGDVIECEHGFRASRAYPLRIFVPLDAAGPRRGALPELVQGLRRYRVPVELLPAGCLDATRVLGLPGYV